MKHIIWSNELNFEEWKDDLAIQYPDEEGYDDDERYRLMEEINDGYYEDEMITLNKEFGRDIIAVANLGLWNGRRLSYITVGTNLNSVLTYRCGEYVTWYVDEDEVKCIDKHHDGTNYYTYRLLNEGIGQFEFNEYAYEHSLKEAVEKYTKPIGHYVAEIYGINLEEKND